VPELNSAQFGDGGAELPLTFTPVGAFRFLIPIPLYCCKQHSGRAARRAACGHRAACGRIISRHASQC